MLLLALQWIVSLIGVFGGIGLIIYLAFKEDWKLGVAGLLLHLGIGDYPFRVPGAVETKWRTYFMRARFG